MQLSRVSKKEALHGLAVTSIFAVIFTCLQGFEYIKVFFFRCPIAFTVQCFLWLQVFMGIDLTTGL